MTLDEMKQKKQEYGYSYAQLSKRSGVPLGTLQKIFTGETLHPRYDTLMALEAALSDRPSCVRETAPAYQAGSTPEQKQQGEYTLEDYYALPDDQRVELIDGVFYDMTAPASFHQLAAGELYYQILDFVKKRGGSCMPFIAPIDVQLDMDERTMVEPDVVILCDTDKLLESHIYGAPDFVLEVISPSTKRKDYMLKLTKYEHAGVREYWIVDPYKETIIVYFFEGNDWPAFYPLDAEVPVNIYNGELQLCLKDVLKWLPKRIAQRDNKDQ